MKTPSPSLLALAWTVQLLVWSSAARAGVESIQATDLRRDVGYLASDALSGRETGEPGIQKAERYIARELKKAGLRPLPGFSDYWIDFTLYRSGYEQDGTFVTLDVGGRSRKGRPGIDFRPFPFTDDGVVEGPLVFAGYGITAPEHAYDDYAGLDVEGKIVLVLRHEPSENDPASSFDGTSGSRHAFFRAKADTAREHGARGMLLVTDPLNHGPADDLRMGGTLSLRKPRAGRRADEASADPLLAFHISRETARALVAASGHSLEALQRAVDGGTSPAELPLPGVAVRLGVARSKTVEEVPARDIAGFLPGRDPALADEWIVVGGHHDHIGSHAGAGDTVFNGADDNASGTSGVIALARAFASRSEKPRRSIVFVTFSGEEEGLLGSRALVEQRLMPVERVAFMLNLDMIGRNPSRALQLVGDGYTHGLRELIERANDGIGLELELAGETYAGNSDHDPFYERDVPFLFFFTGIHDDYHQHGDHADKLDYDRMASILRLAYGIVERIAEADDAPRFIHHVGWLGLQAEVLRDGGAPRAVITGVDEDSGAADAGARVGDVIVALSGEPLSDPDRVGDRFRDVAPGARVALGLLRGGERVELSVERARAGYLGVVPASLDEERRQSLGLHAGEGILLRQVVADGPADRAGLREGDVLVALSGRPVGPEDLNRRLQRIGAGETIDVTVIREGARTTLPLRLGERPNRD